MLLPFFVALLVIIVIKRVFFREKSDIDKVPFAGHAIKFIRYNSTQIWTILHDFTLIHGDRYVIKGFTRTVLHTSRPEDIEVILSHPRNITKGKVYSFLEPWLGTGLLISTGAKWQKRRKILTPTFHFNILKKNFAAVMEEKSRDLAKNLKQQGQEKQALEIDVMRVISDCTLYTICETAMGTKLDQNHTEKQRAYKQAVLDMGLTVLRRVTRVWYWWSPLYYRFPEGQKFQKSLDHVLEFADDVIRKKKQEKMTRKASNSASQVDEDIGEKKRVAMLDLLLEAEMKGEIDLEGIREEVNTFMFEGHDTTAMALSFGLMVLAEHNDVQEKLLEEIHRVVGDREVTTNDLGEMKYLEAVIKEILRLYPSVPFITRYISEDFQMGDILVKKGIEVAVHFYELHRRPDIFENPEEFRPERFLGTQQRHPYAYVPFSAGPRNCIGQRFAMLEMKCIIAELIRSFKLSPSPRCEAPRLQSDLVLRPENKIYVNFTQRSS